MHNPATNNVKFNWKTTSIFLHIILLGKGILLIENYLNFNLQIVGI
jgi:hypothetical protein